MMTPAEKNEETRFVVRALLQGADPEDGPTPSVRHEILKISRDPGGDLAWLAAYDLDADTRMMAVVTLLQFMKKNAAAPAVFRQIADGVIPVFKRALRAQNVPDKDKVFIGTLLLEFDPEFDEDEVRASFRDFDAVLADVEHQVKTPDSTPSSVASLMEGFGPVMHVDEPIPAGSKAWTNIAMIAEQIINENPASAGLFLGAASSAAIYHGVQETEPLERAIQNLARLNSPEAMWQLWLLSLWPFGGALAKAAGQGYDEMMARGIQPQQAFAPPFGHGLVSSCDGRGARQLALFFKNTGGGNDSLLFMFKDSWGLKDAAAGYGDSSEIEEAFREGPEEIAYAPCTLELARELISDAVGLSLELGKRLPPQVYFCRQYFGESPLGLARRTPDLSAYQPVPKTKRASLIAASSKLMEVPIYFGLWFSSDAAYQFIREHREGLTIPEAKYERFMREVCVLSRADLEHRLAVNLEVEALAGRVGRKANRMAACVLSTLKSGDVPFWDIPYVQELAVYSVYAITKNIDHGFQNQDEANEGDLDSDIDLENLSVIDDDL